MDSVGHFREDSTVTLFIHEEHESLKGKLSVFRKELWQMRAGEPTDANGFDLVDLTARDW